MAYAKVVSFLRLIMSDIWWSINLGAKENEGKWTRHRFTYAVVFKKKKKENETFKVPSFIQGGDGPFHSCFRPL